MELDCSGPLMGVAIIVLELKAIGQLLIQGSLSTSTFNFISWLLISIIVIIIIY